ncbi:B12-binding domain-containing radical SAM protein [Krasilnikovia sp. M28-CT-15]|uniref:B12-binding domain-containing radical SAM protein n=1 Tax=Krasilnikovia sp. M28-CT-15 TaxID=3373540 RepID=UPI003875F2C1
MGERVTNVLLVHPPLMPSREVTPPLGLCTLASWLLHLGHDVRILDLDLEVVADGPDQTPRDYLAIFTAALRGLRPDVVAVTSMYSNSLQAERLLKLAKTLDPSIVTVAGGPHFGALGTEALGRICQLDFVIEGEGELAFAELLDALDHGDPVRGIPRLCYRAAGTIHRNAGGDLLDLSVLPPMWRIPESCIDLDRYARTVPVDAVRRVMYIEAGRGCPFACTFCATAPFWQRRYRVKPAGRIVDEMRHLHESHRYNSFILVHDLLTVNKRFVGELCDAMVAARLPVEWMANSRTDLRLDGILPKMKAAGCWKLFFGIESANESVQHAIDKHLDVGAATAAIEDLRDHGISATCSFIIGFPAESARQLSGTIALGARLKLLGAETVQFHRLRLFPPSRLTQTAPAGDFDLDALRIEYPFTDVPAADIAAVAQDPQFFSGYFTPATGTGTPPQLAQVEMFFHHAVALAPLTINAFAQFCGEELVPSFYDTVVDHGGIAREQLDWEGGDLHGNWLVLRPLLEAWIGGQRTFADWQSHVLRALLDYESCRLSFVKGEAIPRESALTRGASWVALTSKVDIAEVLGRLQSGGRLDANLLREGTVVLTRQASGVFGAYTVDSALLPRLMAHEPTLVRAFSG